MLCQTFNHLYRISLIQYINAIMIKVEHDQKVASRMETLGKYMNLRVWEINAKDIQDLPLKSSVA